VSLSARTPGKWSFPKADESQRLEGTGLVEHIMFLILFMLENFCPVPLERLIQNIV
jgi:hypothetical protein